MYIYEIHFILYCKSLTEYRTGILDILKEHDHYEDDYDKVKFVLSAPKLKEFAIELEYLFRARQKVVYG